MPRRLLGAAAAAALLLAAPGAAADRLVIKRPGAHPDYFLEAEPHLNLGIIDPPGVGSGQGIGAGFRATLELVDNGFVTTINNSVGVGFGLDYVHHGIDERDRICIASVPDPSDPTDQQTCVKWQSESADYLLVPIVMQWNFWLSEAWSVFGEPGAVVYVVDDGGDRHRLQVDLSLYAGGRWHFSEAAALTLRLGYPTFSVGVSFLL